MINPLVANVRNLEQNYFFLDTIFVLTGPSCDKNMKNNFFVTLSLQWVNDGRTPIWKESSRRRMLHTNIPLPDIVSAFRSTKFLKTGLVAQWKRRLTSD